MSNKFSDHALNAIKQAPIISASMGHTYTGTEHLLLGIWRAVCEKSFVHLFAVLLAGVIGSVIVYIPAGVKYLRGKK